MSDLPGLEIVDIDTPDDPSLSGRYVKVDDDLELVIKLIREDRLFDREAMTAWCFGHNRTDDLCERMAPERGCLYGLVIVDAAIGDGEQHGADWRDEAIVDRMADQ